MNQSEFWWQRRKNFNNFAAARTSLQHGKYQGWKICTLTLIIIYQFGNCKDQMVLQIKSNAQQQYAISELPLILPSIRVFIKTIHMKIYFAYRCISFNIFFNMKGLNKDLFWNRRTTYKWFIHVDWFRLKHVHPCFGQRDCVKLLQAIDSC